MSSLHPRLFRKRHALKSVQYILRQARNFPVRNIKAILKSGAGTTDETEPIFYKNLKLTFFADNILQSVRECSIVIDKCLRQDNPEAHYIEGILQFFYWDNPNDGLLHLQKSADGMYVSGTVIYGVLMLCLGYIDEAKTYLDSLEWKTNITRINKSWKHIKKSLRGGNVVFTTGYQRNMRRLEPPESCHVNDMDNYCELCFYYKQIKQFIAIL